MYLVGGHTKKEKLFKKILVPEDFLFNTDRILELIATPAASGLQTLRKDLLNRKDAVAMSEIRKGRKTIYKRAVSEEAVNLGTSLKEEILARFTIMST